MLDTNTCIYAMHRRVRVVTERFEQANGQLCISAVTLAELLFGVAKSRQVEANLATISVFGSLVQTMPFDAEAASHYGDIRALLERSGRPVGPNDYLIGAHARSLGLTLVTNNVREFQRMPGLTVENWVS